MSQQIQHFLLVYDHDKGHLIDERDFGTDSASAMGEYARLELEHNEKDSKIEIVLIGSDSIETVRLTHANYFDGTVPASRFLIGLR